MNSLSSKILAVAMIAGFCFLVVEYRQSSAESSNAVVPANATTTQSVAVTAAEEKPSGDCAQWMGSLHKNNVRVAKDVPTDWDVGEIDDETNEWTKGSGKNITWVAKLGSQTYGNPVVAGGKVYVGTNNRGGWLKRFPAKTDLGCLLAFSEKDGSFLWQHSSKKLKSGRVNDWPYQGICCAPFVEGNRLWFVSSRGEVVCLDTEGFQDGENDGPFKDEPSDAKDEADAIWYFDMMKELKAFQHNMCSCSVTAVGDILFVNTSNGVDASHINLPSPAAPSFIALDKNTGKLLWKDSSPGVNILHGQWSSPTYAVLGDVPQVLFAGGDGWLYSFHGTKYADGKPELLWKFDCNPKTSKWILDGRGTRNNVIATPVVHEGLVYIAVGQDPEHGEGQGHLWCIDPTKRGDVSAELAVNVSDRKTPIPHRRLLAVDEKKGEVAIDNPNSAVKWHYMGVDTNGNKELEFEETMHRSCGTVAIKGGLLFIADFSGLFHCLDVKTGKPHWTYDMLAASWGTPLIVDGNVYIGDEDGDVSIFKLSADPAMAMVKDGDDYAPQAELSMGNAVYSTPIIANGALYIANRSHLFRIEKAKK
jgi:outer membrane protein assembly factor BamB